MTIGERVEQPPFMLGHRQFAIDTQVLLEKAATSAIAHLRQPHDDTIARCTRQEYKPEPVEGEDTFIVEINRQRALNLGDICSASSFTYERLTV